MLGAAHHASRLVVLLAAVALSGFAAALSVLRAAADAQARPSVAARPLPQTQPWQTRR